MFRRKLATGVLILATLTGGVMSVAAQQGPYPFGQGDGAIAAALDAAAAETGIDAADILAQLQDGATLADIVTEAGGDVQVVIDAAVGSLTARVDDAVEDGLMAEARADLLIDNLEAAVTEAVNGDWTPGVLRNGPRGRGPMNGRGFGNHDFGGRNSNRGMMGGVFGGNGFGMLGGQPFAGLLDDLGIDPQMLTEELRAGSTVAEAITAAGGDPQAAIDAALAATEERLAQTVENGRITQEDADTRLTDIEARLNDWLDVSPLENRVALQIVPGALRLAVEQTGMTPAELRAELADGATLGEVLAAQGVDEAAFVDTLVERAAARLNVQVVDGRMTQEQADAALADIRAQIEARLDMSNLDTDGDAV